MQDNSKNRNPNFKSSVPSNPSRLKKKFHGSWSTWSVCRCLNPQRPILLCLCSEFLTRTFCVWEHSLSVTAEVWSWLTVHTTGLKENRNVQVLPLSLLWSLLVTDADRLEKTLISESRRLSVFKLVQSHGCVYWVFTAVCHQSLCSTTLFSLAVLTRVTFPLCNQPAISAPLVRRCMALKKSHFIPMWKIRFIQLSG